MAHAGGRPTKYDSIFINKVSEYISTTGREQTELPTKEGFCQYIGINTDTLWEWCKENKELSDAIKNLEERQKNQLINDGMYGGKEVNSTMAIFLLKANHNMIETERKQLVGADGETFRVVIGDGLQGHQPIRSNQDSSIAAGSMGTSGAVQSSESG
jgi:hypothetical protein